MREYHDESSDGDDDQLPDLESTSIRSATPVSIRSPTPVHEAQGDSGSIDTPKTSKTMKHSKKGGKTSKLEEAVHSMVERIKTSDAMDRQLATLLGQMSSQTTDPRDTWISWMGSEMRRVEPQHWRNFQIASLDFIRYWTPQPEPTHQQPAQQPPPSIQPPMPPPFPPPFQQLMQQPFQPPMQQPMQQPMLPPLPPPTPFTSQLPMPASQNPMPASQTPMPPSQQPTQVIRVESNISDRKLF